MGKTFSVTVSGKVQGVFFRASTKQKADELKVLGFVKNQPDGTVYIEVKGNERDLEEFIQWCQRGPTYARVQSVDVREIPDKNFHGFEITRD